MTEFKEKAPHKILGSRSSGQVDSEEEIGYFGPFSVFVRYTLQLCPFSRLSSD